MTNAKTPENYKVWINQGSVKVSFEYKGEGIYGQYDPTDLYDKPLMRFTVYHRSKPIPGATGITNVSAHLPDEDLFPYLDEIMSRVYEPVIHGEDITDICKGLSNIGVTHIYATECFIRSQRRAV